MSKFQCPMKGRIDLSLAWPPLRSTSGALLVFAKRSCYSQPGQSPSAQVQVLSLATTVSPLGLLPPSRQRQPTQCTLHLTLNLSEGKGWGDKVCQRGSCCKPLSPLPTSEATTRSAVTGSALCRSRRSRYTLSRFPTQNSPMGSCSSSILIQHGWPHPTRSLRTFPLCHYGVLNSSTRTPATDGADWYPSASRMPPLLCFLPME